MIRRLLALALLLPSLAWADYQSFILATNPCHYYRLGESSGTAAADLGLGCVHGVTAATYTGGYTLGATSLLASDTVNKAVTLNGTTGYLEIGGSSFDEDFRPVDYRPANGSTDFSWEGWWKPAVGGTTMTLAGSGGSSLITWELRTGGGASNFLYFAVANTASSPCNTDSNVYGNLYTGTSSTFSYVAGSTYYIAVTTTGAGNGSGALTSMKLYINGALNLQKTSGFTGTLCTTNGNIKRFGLRSDGNYFVNGVMDEVAYYDSELTAAQVLAHYNCGLSLAACVSSGGVFPFSVKRDPLPPLKPWSPREWFLKEAA